MILKKWPNRHTIKARLTDRNLVLSNLIYSTGSTEHAHHAKLTGIDFHGNDHPLFIKRCALGEAVANKELFIHRGIIPEMNTQLTPPLRASWADEESRYLVTDDVSQTHFCPGSPNPKINESEFISVIEFYARFHSTYWGQTNRWTDFFLLNACLTVSHEATDATTVEACKSYFLDTCLPQKKNSWGDGFLPEWDDWLPNIITNWAELFTKRCEKPQNLTLIQGDAHLGNVMVPRNPEQAPPLLIDWEGLCIGLGAWDLARLVYHTSWDESSLLGFETLALKHYHRVLTNRGVSEYSYRDLLTDYRLSILSYVPHTLAWGNPESMRIALKALERWDALYRAI